MKTKKKLNKIFRPNNNPLEDFYKKMIEERKTNMKPETKVETMTTETDVEIQNVESPIKVYWSNSYDDFSLIKINRPIDWKRIDKIAAEIEAGNNYLPFYPIVVNSQLEIIDGQHRFLSAKKTYELFYYIISEKMDMKDAANAVSLTKAWNLESRLHFYCEMGLPDYLVVKEFREKHPWIPTTFSISVCSSNGYTPRTFNNGHYKADRKEFAEKVASIAEDFSEYFTGYKTWHFLNALMNLASNPNYNHKRMMQKMLTQRSRLVRCATVEKYLEVMAEIYNFRVSPENRIFFVDQYRKWSRK